MHRPLALDGLDAAEVRLARAEQRDAAAGRHRRDAQADLVDEAGRERLLGDGSRLPVGRCGAAFLYLDGLRS
jgi:hypothetical protein